LPTDTILAQRTQLAALPWRSRGTEIEVLMITSRQSGHWLIPKGWPMKGKTDAEAAAKEAFEEAGVRGEISETPIGSYGYDKLLPDGTSMPCAVDVYLLQATKELSSWPELESRRREWMSLERAAALAFEPDLADLLSRLDHNVIAVNATRTPHRKGKASRN
jgi:8-oxo-dGTP pyrophosphatase MutT (NUDIX family)